MFDRLIEIYVDTGVVDKTNQKLEGLLLHEKCVYREKCWGGQEDPGKLDIKWNKIQIPYVGPFYFASATRLLVLGQNLNEWGGVFSLHKLAVHAQFLLSQGVHEIRFGSTRTDYHGSVFWHRLATYATVILRSDWRIEGGTVWLTDKQITEDAEALADAVGKLAFLNAIKCSPPAKRSKPLDKMWSVCPREYAWKEILQLAPNFILVLGKGTLWSLENSVRPELTLIDKSNDDSISLHVLTIDNRKIPLLRTLHPASPRGRASVLIARLAELVKKNQDFVRGDQSKAPAY